MELDIQPPIELNAIEARVLGCLLEKERSTPDHYPLTVNSLQAACNQLSSRHPVMELSVSEIEEALTTLGQRDLVAKVLGGRSVKFEHNLGEHLPLTTAAQALLAVLLLRGTQTAGELKQRTERLYRFESLGEVEERLGSLMEHSCGPVVERIPVGGGRRVETFRHLLCGGAGGERGLEGEPVGEGAQELHELVDRLQELEERVGRLEARLSSEPEEG